MSTSPLRRLARAAGALDGLCRERFIEWALDYFTGSPKADAVLSRLAEKYTSPADWRRPETIGWLFQYFTAAARRPNRQGASPRGPVPGATGLYTPEWVTSYLLRRTLDRAVESADTIPQLKKITLLDPACGTGHILLAAYDRLEEAYLRLGYPPGNIPRAILQNNLFGLEIDEQTARLARRLLALRAGNGALNAKNIRVIDTFPHAGEIGSLLDPSPEEIPPSAKDSPTVNLLTRHYDCVVTNPPYLGWKGIPPSVKAYVQAKGYLGRGNLDALFIERALRFLVPGGRAGLITTQGWMFLPTFRRLLRHLLENAVLEEAAHLGTGVFEALGGEVVASCAFILRAAPPGKEHRPLFYRLVDYPPAEKQKRLRQISAKGYKEPKNKKPPLFCRHRQSDYLTFPNAGLYYHLGPAPVALLREEKTMGDWFDIRQGMATGDNRRFLRPWYKIPPEQRGTRWIPYAKGEGTRRWASAVEYFIDWENDGEKVRASEKSVIRNPGYFFREGVSWSYVGTGPMAARLRRRGAIFDVGASTLFARFREKTFPAGAKSVRLSDTDALKLALGFLNTPIAAHLIRAINPSTNCQVGDIKRLPFPLESFAAKAGEILPTVTRLIEIHQGILQENPRLFGFRASALRALSSERRSNFASLDEALDALAKEQTKRRETIDALEAELAALFGDLLGVNTPKTDTSAKTAAKEPIGSDRWRAGVLADLLADLFGPREGTAKELRALGAKLFGKKQCEKNLGAAAALLRCRDAEGLIARRNRKGRKRYVA
ncbi:MAG: N-6 DNA methylase [Thermoguttaceae bacterium]|nr:N-6 DNA methylase [Thermoguttaceae bacterium]